MLALGLTPEQRQEYRRRLFSSHDYRIDVDVLNLDEKPVGQVQLLDGQINIQSGDMIRRTCSLTVSDPTGMLDFTGAAEWSGTSVWVNRLIRVRHILKVPRYGIPGDQVAVTCFVGPPSAISRDGAEVSVECQDKAALANRGRKPLTIPKGTNVATAIRRILAERAGEFRFRLGTRTQRTTQPYSVGWADETSPWAVATLIARRELQMQLIYSADGFVVLRRRPATGQAFTVPWVTSEATSDVDFTDLVNWVRVTGKSTVVKKTTGGVTVTTTTTPQATATAASGPLRNLSRKGVAIRLPVLIQDDAITSAATAKQRAEAELANGSRLDSSQTLSCAPFFHGDVDDRIKFNVPGNDVIIRLDNSSIPLGPGEMSVGTVRLVSRPRRAATKSWIRTKVKRKATKAEIAAAKAAARKAAARRKAAKAKAAKK